MTGSAGDTSLVVEIVSCDPAGWSCNALTRGGRLSQFDVADAPARVFQLGTTRVKTCASPGSFVASTRSRCPEGLQIKRPPRCSLPSRRADRRIRAGCTPRDTSSAPPHQSLGSARRERSLARSTPQTPCATRATRLAHLRRPPPPVRAGSPRCGLRRRRVAACRRLRRVAPPWAPDNQGGLVREARPCVLLHSMRRGRVLDA